MKLKTRTVDEIHDMRSTAIVPGKNQEEEMKRILLLAVIAGIGAVAAVGGARQCWGGAWTQDQGKFYDRLAVNYYYADREFDLSGHTQAFDQNGNFQDLNLSNYIEYGLRDNLTLINSVYYKRIEKKSDIEKTTEYGMGDVDLAVKYRILNGSGGVLSTQALTKIPGPYDKNAPLPLGNGQLDLELRVLYGVSLWKLFPGYANVELGYRWRLGDPSDEVRYLLEVGSDFSKTMYGRIKLDGLMSRDNGKHMDAAGNPTTTNNFDLGKLYMTLGFKMNSSWGLEIEYTPSLYGQNTAAGSTYTFAFIFLGI